MTVPKAGAAPPRCDWAARGDALEQAYHDTEWGVPVHDDRVLFEFLILEGAQAGLSWRTVLGKREGYRRLFADFDPEQVAAFGDGDVDRISADPAIIRHRGKVAAAVANARAFCEMQAQYGTFATWLWGHVDDRPIVNRWSTVAAVPASTPLAERLAKDLRSRGFRFVGPTIVYAFLQAVGVVDDHLETCFRRSPPSRAGDRR